MQKVFSICFQTLSFAYIFSVNSHNSPNVTNLRSDLVDDAPKIVYAIHTDNKLLHIKYYKRC